MELEHRIVRDEAGVAIEAHIRLEDGRVAITPVKDGVYLLPHVDVDEKRYRTVSAALSHAA